MAAPMDSDDEDAFVTLGTPFPDVDDDAPARKPVSFQDLAVKDSKGRTRFHGAFTGGFSAGHFNTVGSKEGFTPSTFVSSRDKKSVDRQQFKPEDFMDDEDFGEYGIAPKKLVTADTYSSEERRKRRLDQAKSLTSGTIISGEPALADLILPERLTVGIKLLRKLGWKEGQGLGPRERRAKKPSKKKPVMKIYGCAPPPGGSGDDSSEEDLPSDVTFAPKDTNPVSLVAKDNVHGLGYSGLDPRSALPSTHINLFAPPPISKSGRKGITGQAFGIGALEDDDEDIYATDHMSNYDVTMEIDDGSERLFGWTAPGRNQNRNQNIRADYIGKVLEGFSLSSKPLKQKKSFGPPVLPKNFTPVHRFMKIPQSAVSGLHGRKENLNSVSRGVILGDTPIMNSVFDLIPKESQAKLNTAKQSLEVANGTKDLTDGQSLTFSDKRTANKTSKPSRFSSSQIDLQDNVLSNKNSTISPGGDMQDKSSGDQDLTMSLINTSVTDKPSSQAPLFQGTDISFKPFAKDSQKQARYEKYLALLKLKKDAYEDVAEGHMTEWEREREKEEFIRASKLFKPMSNAMASRFTSAKHNDNADEYVDVPAEEEGDQDDKSKAAKMKMYGRLTRDTFEWHPDRLLCQRFNVPDPYPSSNITGLPTIKRDKYSVFNFLDLSTKQPEQADVRSTADVSSSSDPGSKGVKSSGFHMTIQAHKPPPMKSIFSVLMKEPPDNQTSVKQPAEEREVTPVDSATAPLDQKSTETPTQDLFETIFGNTDSEESSDAADIEEPQKHNDNLLSKVIPLQETVLPEIGSLKSPEKHKTAESKTAVAETADGRQGLSQTSQSRLSPPCDSSVVENNTEAYGPSLPPKTVEQHSTKVLQRTSSTEHKFSGGGDALSGSLAHKISGGGTSSSSLRHRTGGGDTSSGSLKHRNDGVDTSSGSLKHRTDGGDTCHSSSVTKSKHKHKHKKDKKSKHKKDKKKKREKKEKKRKKYSSDDTDSSDDVPSDKQLLQIMKSVGGDRHYRELT